MIPTLASSIVLLAASAYIPSVAGHISAFHPSMWGFNVTDNSPSAYPGDNRPVVPLMHRPFNQWWFHGLLDYPPHPGDIMQLPAGGTKTIELACDKGATSYFASSAGSVSVEQGNNPCPGYPMSQYHTNGINDLGGCGLAIAYKSNVNDVKPEDFTMFSIQHQCVWNRFTPFDIPAAMPPCPNGKCICAWFWIHKPDSGSEQMFMTGFQCNIDGATGTRAVAKGKVPRRCGADPANNKPADPSNCTVGAKSPLYWYQQEGNNMFEGDYSPPLYLPLYGFEQGAQNDIFEGAAIPVTTSSSVSVVTSTTSSSASAAVTTSSSSVAAGTTSSPSTAGTSSPAGGASSSAGGASSSGASSSVVGGAATTSSINGGGGGGASSSAAPAATSSPSNVNGGGGSPATTSSSSVQVATTSAVQHNLSTSSVGGGGGPASSSSAAGSPSSSAVRSSATYVAPPAATTSPGSVNPPATTVHNGGGSPATTSAAAPFTTSTNSHGQVCKKRTQAKKRATLGELARAQEARKEKAVKRHLAKGRGRRAI